MMKPSKPFPQPNTRPSKLPSTTSTKNFPSQIHQLTPQTTLFQKTKDILTAKAQPQEPAQKISPSVPQLKDISNIVSEPILHREICPDNDISGISIINMLSEGNSKPFLPGQNVLNLDLAEDGSEIMKKELQMKNRLIEKLMKENAILREEMEICLTSVEEAKGHLNLNLKGYDHRILELESHIENLETENRSLKETVDKQSEENTAQDVQIQQLERKIQTFLDAEKNSLDDFYLNLNDQLTNFLTKTKTNQQDFWKIIQGHIEQIKSPNPSNPSHNLSLTKTIHNPRDSANETKVPELPLYKRFSTESSLTNSHTSTRDLSMKSSLSARKTATESHNHSGKTLNGCTKIDEIPEFDLEKRRATTVVRSYQVIDNLKKNESASLSKRNSEVRASLKDFSAAKSSARTRVSTAGSLIERKKL